MKITRILLVAALLSVAACSDNGVSRPPPTDIKFFNAASNFDVIRLLREAKLEANLGFGRGTNLSFDSGQYEFTLQTLAAGIIPSNRYTLAATLSPTQTTTFVAYSDGADLKAFTVANEDIVRSETHTRYTVIHANTLLDDIDVYIVPVGTALDTVAPNGTTRFGPSPARFEVAEGDYKLFLTPAGQPNAPFYESVDFFVTAGNDKTLVIFDPGDQSLADVDVVDLIENGAARLIQVGVESLYRVLVAVDDRNEDREIYFNDELTPFFAAPLPFAEPTVSSVVPNDALTINLTPAGNPGTVESTTFIIPVPGLSYLTAFAGDTTDGIDPVSMIEDKRRILDQATVTVLHAAGLFDRLAIYIVSPGTDVTTVQPVEAFVRAPAVTERFAYLPDDYELVVRDTATGTIIAGPTPVTLEGGGIYFFALVNGADGATVDVKFLYDLAP